MITDEPVDPDRDPFAYLERTEFTSERFKIEVHGLPKYYGIREFKKLLKTKLELSVCKVKPPKQDSDWLYVSFKDEESRKKGLEKLNGISWKNSVLSAQNAKPAPDPFVKRKLEEEEDDTTKRMRVDGMGCLDNLGEMIKESTISLWDMPYPEQLELKKNRLTLVLTTTCKKVLKTSLFELNKLKGANELGIWFKSQQAKYDGLPCELLPILSTDKITEYRNKCEFTVGKGMQENQVIIGFRVSKYSSGSTTVGPIDKLCHIPDKMKAVVKVLEEFMQNSELKPFNPVDHSGHWRQVTARTSQSGDLMIIVGLDPHDLSSEKLEEIKSQLKEFFETGKGVNAHVTSLYLQTMGSTSRQAGTDQNYYHISGSEYIEETLLGMKFRISPQAFFQVNTLGAEVLYKAAIDLAKPTMETSVLDICCGTGTIGLAFSKHCGEVIGVEVVEDAVKDARANIAANKVKNCDFLVGKAEDILEPVIARTTKPRVIAVVDPPRVGLRKNALLTLRRAKKISRLIYISCEPKAAMSNIMDLARPSSKQYVGEPFVPVKAVPVDMFPHTKHCELVICLERLSDAMKARDSPHAQA